MNWIVQNPDFILRTITVMFIVSAIAYAVAGDLAMFGYNACAAGLQIFVMMK